MKKVMKFILGLAAIVGGIAGAVYLVKHFLDKDDFEDFDEDEFDDVFADDEKNDDRDYVTLDFEESDAQEEN